MNMTVNTNITSYYYDQLPNVHCTVTLSSHCALPLNTQCRQNVINNSTIISKFVMLLKFGSKANKSTKCFLKLSR